MSMMLNSFWGATSSYTIGALVYDSVAAVTTSTNSVPFDSEAYDGGYHSGGASERLTIPTGPTKARLIANLYDTDSDISNVLMRVNGASSFLGRVVLDCDSTGAGTTNGASAIISVSSADYYTLYNNSGGTTLDAGAYQTWFAIEVLNPKGALVHKSADQSLPAATITTLTFDSENYDTDAFHDNVTNNSRLTVPSGVSLVRISASILITGGATQSVLTFLKNGASARGLPAEDQIGVDLNAVSAVLAVSSSDYFEMQAFRTSAATIVADDATWFCIEEVPAARKYAVVYKSASQTISNATTTVVDFGAELADTDAFHDNSTNNSRLTVPSGCSRARLSFNVKTPSAAAEMIAKVTKNGSADVPGLPGYENDTSGTDSLNGFGAWVDVTPGDYFELTFYQVSGANMTLADDNALWFCIEAE